MEKIEFKICYNIEEYANSEKLFVIKERVVGFTRFCVRRAIDFVKETGERVLYIVPHLCCGIDVKNNFRHFCNDNEILRKIDIISEQNFDISVRGKNAGCIIFDDCNKDVVERAYLCSQWFTSLKVIIIGGNPIDIPNDKEADKFLEEFDLVDLKKIEEK